jgi:hypothetical protein
VVISEHRHVTVKFLCQSVELSQFCDFLVIESWRFPLQQTLYILECIMLHDKKFDNAFDLDSRLIHLFAPEYHNYNILSSGFFIVINYVLQRHIPCDHVSRE